MLNRIQDSAADPALMPSAPPCIRGTLSSPDQEHRSTLLQSTKHSLAPPTCSRACTPVKEPETRDLNSLSGPVFPLPIAPVLITVPSLSLGLDSRLLIHIQIAPSASKQSHPYLTGQKCMLATEFVKQPRSPPPPVTLCRSPDVIIFLLLEGDGS